ncbi:MAG TPA: pyridoxal phosphate-dependent aminotransferase [Oceanospirillales bacterium]|nr:pyridoxal phosphate-dependent aminotransferase [Oceanospirillales bacterium]
MIKKSSRLNGVCYDIRGPVLDAAKNLEDQGNKILKLNIGNPAAFDFATPPDIVKDVIQNLANAEGYCDSKGLYSARVAIYQHYQQQFSHLNFENIFIGNGVSELILMSMQALLNNDDEILIPAPDYPLWTAAVNLSGGKAVHYLCDEEQNWAPNIADIKAKISSKTRGIVVINPNNPTGAVYTKQRQLELIELAREHNLIIYSDEIYEKIIYDHTQFTSMAALADDIMFVTFNGLSKIYRAAGYRTGWMVISGKVTDAKGYIEGLEMIASMRLCANVPGQYAIQTALGGRQSIDQLINKGGRLNQQRLLTHEMINAIPGLSTTKPLGALYCFVKVDTNRFNIKSDEQMVLDLLTQKHILLVHGTGFNWPRADHFRLVFLPHSDVLKQAISRMADFFSNYQQKA